MDDQDRFTEPSSEDGLYHRPVLYHEIIHALQPNRGGLYVDCTVGAGGHAWGILQASSPDGKLLGLDVDPQALELARQRLAPFGSRAVLIRASYTTLSEQLQALSWHAEQSSAVNGILLDLGVSSMQLDTPERGFSFQVDASLDMRFDPTQSMQASDLVNTLPEVDLARLLFEYGEEQRARQIAQAIVRARPVSTTGQLTEIVAQVAKWASTGKNAATGRGHHSKREKVGRRTHPGSRSIHPATLTFQALRIAVNHELESLHEVLPQAVEALLPGGRLAIISFHSLEDRIVKQYFRQESRDCLCPPRQPVCTCGHRASLVEITRHPVQPQADEVAQNPRSRSARLRVAEKVTSGK